MQQSSFWKLRGCIQCTTMPSGNWIWLFHEQYIIQQNTVEILWKNSLTVWHCCDDKSCDGDCEQRNLESVSWSTGQYSKKSRCQPKTKRNRARHCVKGKTTQCSHPNQRLSQCRIHWNLEFNPKGSSAGIDTTKSKRWKCVCGYQFS